MTDPTSLELIQERNWLSTELHYGEASPRDAGLRHGCGYIRYERAGRSWHVTLCPDGAELPQSEHGGLHPELRARLTNSTAALGDFDHWLSLPSGNVSTWQEWAHRLAAELRSLLEIIERHPS